MGREPRHRIPYVGSETHGRRPPRHLRTRRIIREFKNKKKRRNRNLTLQIQRHPPRRGRLSGCRAQIPKESMSIADCRHCKRSYWRFRKEFPPAGYCCDLHAELGPAKKPPAPKPPKPDAALFDLRAHRITIHRDRFFLQWYKCDECDRLEAVYSEAMAYWIDHPATRAIEEATAEAVKL